MVMAKLIEAVWFDGRSARRHPVHLDLRGGEVTVIGAGVLNTYPRDAVTMAEPYADAPCVLDFADGSRCEVSDADARRHLADKLGYRPSAVERGQRKWPVAIGALLVLIAAVGAAVEWIIPDAAERMVAAMPVSLDAQVGGAAVQALDGKRLMPTRLSGQRIADVNGLYEAIRPVQTRMPLKLLIRSVPGIGPNALALPDGTIVLTDMMVGRIVRPAPGKRSVSAPFAMNDYQRAQLAGVLLHEIGHVEGRHGMRALARSSLTAGLSAALFGDFSAVAAGAPALLLQMRYSRRMETDADVYAQGALGRLGMPSAPLADLFDGLLADGKPSALPAWLRQGLEYAASHPSIRERSVRLRTAPQ